MLQFHRFAVYPSPMSAFLWARYWSLAFVKDGFNFLYDGEHPKYQLARKRELLNDSILALGPP